MKKVFKIEGKELLLDINSLYEDSYEINSMPLNYSVNFCNSLIDVENIFEKKFQTNFKSRFVIWDSNVHRIYNKDFQSVINNIDILIAKESNKNIKSVLRVIDNLQGINFTKKETLVSIGGGIIQDISAFTRSIYKRGLDWIFVPTTLLSMADSCIGAKTALNYKGVKNQLALFSAPKNVIICPSFLKSLKTDDNLSGLGEILKLVIIGGDYTISEFNRIYFEELDEDKKMCDLIKLSLKIKKLVIEEDEFENDIRRSLNYGHTIGHAIEPIVNYSIPHGIAVTIGMIIENNIAVHGGYLQESLANRYNELLKKFVPTKFWKKIDRIDFNQLRLNLLQDKKTLNTQINFAVPDSLNSFGIYKIESEKLTVDLLLECFNNAKK
jgi:3-dehydroquinate synthase